MEDNQVEVEILTQTITARYGTLAQGDKLRTDPAFAKHLVEDAKAAKYTSTAGRKSAEQAGEEQGNTGAAPGPAPTPTPSPAPTPAPTPVKTPQKVPDTRRR